MEIRLGRLLVAIAVSALPALSGTAYNQINLVSDIPGMAAITDPNLVNPWGLASSATSPWWVSDNGTGLSTLYNGNTGAITALVVTIPPAGGGSPPSAPDGMLFNSTTGFKVGANPASFIFATENGTISAWNGSAGTNAVLKVDNAAGGAVYKGIALGNSAAGNVLYAANFNSGKIDVFDSNFAATSLAGSFTDATLPSGYAPFDVENINGKIYVTYALQDAAKHDDVAGAGNGFVDIFDVNGNFVQRLISNGPLDSPWGMAIAPANFGSFSGDLLVGNFGDGTINAFDPLTGSLLGDLTGSTGNPITIPGLWGLAFGNGGNGGATNSLFFTAGIPGGGRVEDHGLFGDLVATPEPGALWLVMIGVAGIVMIRRFRVNAR